MEKKELNLLVIAGSLADTRVLAFIFVVVQSFFCAAANACDCGCGRGPQAAGVQTASFNVDFFTNYGEYMPRMHCLRSADGSPDWPWIVGLIVLNTVVMAGYVRIFLFWRRCYRSEEPQDRNAKLMQLAWMFVLCAACGYGMSTLIFFWPGYRLLALMIACLAFVTWRFAIDLEPFRQAFTSHRLQRQLNEALAKEQDRLISILRSSPISMVMVDAKGRITLTNQEVETLFGYTSGELLNKPFKRLLSERFREVGQWDHYFAHPSDRRRVGVGREIYGQTKCGQEIPVEINLNPVETSDGLFVLCSILDTTEQKEREHVLQEARKQALAASKAKSEFLANMSHEIRTPMNAIIGLTDMVLGSELDELQRDYLTTVSDSADSLLQVINDILDFSKIEAGKIELEATEFQIRDLLGDLLKSLAVKARRRDLEVTYRVATEVPEVLVGDMNRLRQILVNLVGNAIKFTEQGHVFVDVKRHQAHGIEGDRVTLKFSVEDTGVGIEENQRESIFGEFEQADASTTRKFGGTGLGLAITSRLVEAMGGNICVESTLGVGSTFSFTAEFERSDSQAKQPWRDVLRKLEGAKVLVVDDHPVNLTILREMLAAHNMEVDTATSGMAAIEMLSVAAAEHQRYATVVTDIHMPKMDGYAFIEKMRQIERLHDVPVIALTSAGDSEKFERLKTLGIKGRLLKPVKPSELYELIVRALGLAEVIESSQPCTVEDVPKEDAGSAALASSRILLAEDSVPNQKLALAILDKGGHTTVVVQNGRDAVDAVQSQDFDVVLMDVQMPQMDGFEATAAIRKHDTLRGRHTPIVAMTAHAMRGDKERCLVAGMDDYVSKPIRPDELFAAIGRVLGSDTGQPSDLKFLRPDALPAAAIEIPWDELLSVVGGEYETLVAIVDAYAEEITEVVPLINQAIQQGDAALLCKSSHKLKSSLKFFQMSDAADLAQQLENAGDREELSAADALWTQLRDFVDRLQPALAEYCDQANQVVAAT